MSATRALALLAAAAAEPEAAAASASAASANDGLPQKQQILAIAVAFLVLVLIFDLVRKRRLREEYSWMWLLTGVLVMVAAFWYDFLRFLTWAIGAGQPTSTLFFFGLIFVILLCLQFSVRLSRLTGQVKNLAQEMAILRAERDELRESERASGGPRAHADKGEGATEKRE